MPQSFVSLHVHVVFSTKNRISMIDEDLQPRLFEYIGGILRGCDSSLIIEEVRRYLVNQAEHHARRSFKDELRALLERHNIEYDERYLWD